MCPHCGYCPHCGRYGYGTMPVNPYYQQPWIQPVSPYATTGGYVPSQTTQLQQFQNFMDAQAKVKS